MAGTAKLIRCEPVGMANSAAVGSRLAILVLEGVGRLLMLASKLWVKLQQIQDMGCIASADIETVAVRAETVEVV